MKYNNEVVGYNYDSKLWSNNTETEQVERGTVLFHCYWHGTVSRKQVFSIKSVLATQDYALTVILWLHPDSIIAPEVSQDVNTLLSKYGNRFKIRTFYFEHMALGTPLHGVELEQESRAGESDNVRVLLLLQYGGLYFDLDCFFLRSIERFLGCSFVYSWDIDTEHANTAILCADRDTAQRIAAHCASIKSCHPAKAFSFKDGNMEKLGLTVYPCYLFDPGWRCTDGAPDGIPTQLGWNCFFKDKCTCSLSEFYPNSCVYHWHSCWNDEVCIGSFFDVFEHYIDNRLGLLGSPYREDKVTMFVVQHAPGNLSSAFSDEHIAYRQIQGGAAVNDPIPGIIHDNDGTAENVSNFNLFLNELSAHYWVRNNIGIVGTEYVGFCHYRRKIYIDVERLKHDTVCVAPWRCCGMSVYDHYRASHVIEDLETFVRELKKQRPADMAFIDEFLHCDFFYVANLYVMHIDQFVRLWEFMTPCIKLAIKLIQEKTVDISERNAYQSRSLSFVLERITGYWFYYQSKIGNITVNECARSMV